MKLAAKNGTMPRPTRPMEEGGEHFDSIKVDDLVQMDPMVLESEKPLTERTAPIDPNLFPITYESPETFIYPGRPQLDATSPPVDIPVVAVSACTVCGQRKYHGTMPPRIYFNRVHCQHCKCDRTFKLLPKEEWDAYAGGSDARPTQLAGSPEQGKQEPLVSGGQDIRPGIDHPLPKGRPNGKENAGGKS